MNQPRRIVRVRREEREQKHPADRQEADAEKPARQSPHGAQPVMPQSVPA